MKTVAYTILLILLSACDSEDNQQNITDTDVPELKTETTQPKSSTYTSTIKKHPLKDYFKAEGYKVLNYFGKQYAYCGKEEEYKQVICKEQVEKAVALAKKHKINATAEDFTNPHYLAEHLRVLELKKQKIEEIRNKYFGKPKALKSITDETHQFEENAEQLLKQLTSE